MSIPKVTDRTPLLSGFTDLASVSQESSVPQKLSDQGKCELAIRLCSDKNNVICGEGIIHSRLIIQGQDDGDVVAFARDIKQALLSRKVHVTVGPFFNKKIVEVPLFDYLLDPKNKVDETLVKNICLLADVEFKPKTAEKAKAYRSTEEKKAESDDSRI